MTLRLVPALHRATHAVAMLLDRAPHLGVKQADAYVMAHHANSGQATFAEIHQAYGHKRSTRTIILYRLEARELITREVSADDRRSFVVALTRQGRSLAAKVAAHLEAFETDVRHHVGKADAETFARVARAIAEIAERKT